MSHITTTKAAFTEFDIEIDNVADEYDSREEWVVNVMAEKPNGRWVNVGDEVEGICGICMPDSAFKFRPDAKSFALQLADALKAKGFKVSGRIIG